MTNQPNRDAVELIERLRRGPVWGNGEPIGSTVGEINGATMNEAAALIEALALQATGGGVETRSYYDAADELMHFINAFDSEGMDANAVRSAIYHKCLEMRPTIPPTDKPAAYRVDAGEHAAIRAAHKDSVTVRSTLARPAAPVLDVKAGDTYINEGDDYWASGIDIGEHGNAIVCFAWPESAAIALRDKVLAALHSNTEPAAPVLDGARQLVEQLVSAVIATMTQAERIRLGSLNERLRSSPSSPHLHREISDEG